MALLGLLSASNAPAGEARTVVEGDTNRLSLEVVVSAVLSNNPSLTAASADWMAMKQRIPQARAWEDLRAGVDVERFGTTRFDTFTDNEWMVAQELPLSGKNRLSGKSATAEALAAFETFRRRQLDLTAKARLAYYNLANAWEQLAINDRNLSLLDQFIRVTRSKYEAGTGSQSDVLVAETGLTKMQEGRFDTLREISDAESRLNVLMNRPARAPLGRPEAPAFYTLELDADRLEALALERRPELQIGQQKLKAAEARYQLARRQWIPDPEIRVEARQYNGRGGGLQEYDTGVFFKVPWMNFGKYRAAIEEARQAKLSSEHELEGMQKETLGLLREQLKKIETFHHHTDLFRDKFIPLARQNVTATRAAYETDKTGFLNLIDAQRTLYEVESMYWHHLATYLSALAELEALVGADLKSQPASPHATMKHAP